MSPSHAKKKQNKTSCHKELRSLQGVGLCHPGRVCACVCVRHTSLSAVKQPLTGMDDVIDWHQQLPLPCVCRCGAPLRLVLSL